MVMKKVKEDIMNELDPLLILYYANVLKHRNLMWLGEDNLYQLHFAWTYLF